MGDNDVANRFELIVLGATITFVTVNFDFFAGAKFKGLSSGRRQWSDKGAAKYRA